MKLALIAKLSLISSVTFSFFAPDHSALLGVLVSSSLRQGPGTARGLWRYDELCLVGERFNGWLTYVRHRGAFSTIYPAYSTAAAAIIRSNWSEIENLPHSWINTFLVAIASAQLSTTRRSAGIGYAVLALVGAHPNKQDASVLNETVQRLVAIAADDKSESKARIHALNVVRVLVLDGALSEVMAPFVGELLTLTIRCFSSTE